MKAALALAFGLIVIVAGVTGAAGSKRNSPPPVRAPQCEPVLETAKHGRDAVESLGDRISEVAQKHGRSGTKLTRQLLKDSSLWVDPCGELQYRESDEIPKNPPEAAATLVFPREQTFALHSKGGASRVIYLDFNGELISGTAWNASFTGGQDVAATAFDIDGAPSSFSDDEMAIIQNVWLRVAEDFAAFDVNVTTADPGLAAIDRTSSTDSAYGTRALITNDSTIYQACGCAGIAYVGVFNTGGSHQYYQPAWVLQRATGANAKVIGEVVSHEVGHNLGLSHDGTSNTSYYTGQGSWAPIMGTAYNRPISQWSRGEYANANNTEDDYAVMQAYGLAVRSDDVANTRSSATALQSGVAFKGRVNSAADVDWFSISGSGQLNVVANVAATSPNLDIKVELFDAAGVMIAAADPPAQTVSGDTAAGLSVNTTFALPAPGTYFLRVDGTGYGDPASSGYSDYASFGEYSLTATPFDPNTAPTITTTSLPTAVYGQSYSATLTAANGVSPYTFGLTADSAPLPEGLALSANTGQVFGTPTAAAGTYSLKFKVVDKQNNSTTKSLSITLQDPALVVTSAIPLAPASLTQLYSYQLSAAGGRGNYVWSIASGSLPLGMTLSTGGLISGTPTKASTYSFTVRVTSGALAVTKSLSISVTAPVVVKSSVLLDASVNVSYSTLLSAGGGTTKYVWEIADGSLPAGLYLTGAYIKGIPTAVGSFQFTVRVTDTAGRSATGQVTINVYGPVSAVTSALPSATKGVYYSFQMEATGGKPPYKWARASGSFPRGITMSTVGLIYGTTTYTGTYTIKFKVVDASGRRLAYVTLPLVVNAPEPTGGTATDTPDDPAELAITTAALPDGIMGIDYSFQMAASGGAEPYKWTRASGSFPKNVTMSTLGLIYGKPGATGTFSIKFKLEDANRSVRYTTLTMVVTAG